MLMPVMLIMLAFRPVSSHTVSGKIMDDNGTRYPAVTRDGKRDEYRNAYLHRTALIK